MSFLSVIKQESRKNNTVNFTCIEGFFDDVKTLRSNILSIFNYTLLIADVVMLGVRALLFVATLPKLIIDTVLLPYRLWKESSNKTELKYDGFKKPSKGQGADDNSTETNILSVMESYALSCMPFINLFLSIFSIVAQVVVRVLLIPYNIVRPILALISSNPYYSVTTKTPSSKKKRLSQDGATPVYDSDNTLLPSSSPSIASNEQSLKPALTTTLVVSTNQRVLALQDNKFFALELKGKIKTFTAKDPLYYASLNVARLNATATVRELSQQDIPTDLFKDGEIEWWMNPLEHNFISLLSRQDGQFITNYFHVLMTCYQRLWVAFDQEKLLKTIINAADAHLQQPESIEPLSNVIDKHLKDFYTKFVQNYIQENTELLVKKLNVQLPKDNQGPLLALVANIPNMIRNELRTLGRWISEACIQKHSSSRLSKMSANASLKALKKMSILDQVTRSYRLVPEAFEGEVIISQRLIRPVITELVRCVNDENTNWRLVCRFMVNEDSNSVKFSESEREYYNRIALANSKCMSQASEVNLDLQEHMRTPETNRMQIIAYAFSSEEAQSRYVKQKVNSYFITQYLKAQNDRTQRGLGAQSRQDARFDGSSRWFGAHDAVENRDISSGTSGRELLDEPKFTMEKLTF